MRFVAQRRSRRTDGTHAGTHEPPPSPSLLFVRHKPPAGAAFAVQLLVALAVGLALLISQWHSYKEDLLLPTHTDNDLLFHLAVNGTVQESSATTTVQLGTLLAPVSKSNHASVDQTDVSGLSKGSPIASKSAPSLEDLSSVDYVACCGLGHRMTRMSDAHLVAQRLRLAFRAFWGYCADDDHADAVNKTSDLAAADAAEPVEVFHYLFGPQPKDELRRLAGGGGPTLTSRHGNFTYDHYVRLSNKANNFAVLRRFGPQEGRSCPCTNERVDSDVKFYASLRQRFRFRGAVDEFRIRHFGRRGDSGSGGQPVLGMHIRAGNGEQGHFAKRGRAAADLDSWLQSLATLLQSRNEWNASTVFVATDTPRLIPSLQALLKSTTSMKVVSLDQSRPEKGKGVLFGEQSQVVKFGGEKCLKGWVDALSDMILLSHTDVVIAARPSSFVQSMPLSLVFETSAQARSRDKEYCEVNQNATEMRCYGSVMDWCCNGTTTFSLDGISQRYDFITVPTTNVSHPDMYMGFQPRATAAPIASHLESPQTRSSPLRCPPRGLHRRQYCVPYDWSVFY